MTRYPSQYKPLVSPLLIDWKSKKNRFLKFFSISHHKTASPVADYMKGKKTNGQRADGNDSFFEKLFAFRSVNGLLIGIPIESNKQ